MRLAQLTPTAMLCGLILSSSDQRIRALLARKTTSIAEVNVLTVFLAPSSELSALDRRTIMCASSSKAPSRTRSLYLEMCRSDANGRHPDARSFRALLSVTSPDASGSITPSFDKAQLTSSEHQPIGVAVRQKASFRHLLVVELLTVASHVSQKYGLALTNCWRFARMARMALINSGHVCTHGIMGYILRCKYL